MVFWIIRARQKIMALIADERKRKKIVVKKINDGDIIGIPASFTAAFTASRL